MSGKYFGSPLWATFGARKVLSALSGVGSQG